MGKKIDTVEFMNLVADGILKEINEHIYGIVLHDVKVIPVWLCKTIQNHKGLFIVKNEYDYIYSYFIEATYNGDKGELYLDFYRKDFKKTINLNTNEEEVE